MSKAQTSLLMRETFFLLHSKTSLAQSAQLAAQLQLLSKIQSMPNSQQISQTTRIKLSKSLLKTVRTSST
jgi:hypothetical protein